MEGLRRIGRYELECCLGGGMAAVYRAYDPLMGRTVAVKILEETHDGGDAKRRFLQEAEVAAKLTHANVVRTYDRGVDDQGRPFIVMEYVPGHDLAKAIAGGTTGDLRTKIETATHIAAALDYIHSHGIVHRDIKPENICIAENGDVKLMDFGIAKLGSVSLTQMGYTLGTPPYMAPEQIQGAAATTVSDIYAFGVLLYELVAGVRAFQADSFELIFYKILNERIDPQPLREHGATAELCDFIVRCAAKDPANRPQSFSEVRTALLAIHQSAALNTPDRAPEPASFPVGRPDPQNGPTSEAPFRERMSSTAIWVAAAALLTITLVAGVVILGGKKAGSLPRQINTSTGPMVLVPAGAFLATEKNETFSLPDYYIDKTEVTNDSYAAFCKATGRSLPPAFPANKAEYPVVNISYADAEGFAAWVGKRLPNSREWEKAARGTAGGRFPWGDDADAGRANVKNNPKSGNVRGLAPADAFPSGASPFGALNLIGNAWEFINEDAQPTPQEFASFKKAMPDLSPGTPWVKIRGGSFMEDLDPTSGWNSALFPGDRRNHLIGFRCVRDTFHAATSR